MADPTENFAFEAPAAYFRDQPVAAPRGCPMVEGLYIKANGELPCWAHIGESLILAQVDQAWLDSDEGDLIGMPAITSIRQAFSEGRLPHPSLCQHCVYLGDGSVKSLRPDQLDRIYVEPSYLCGLDCPACISPKTRLTLKKPPYYLDPALFEAMLRRLRREGVLGVRIFHFEGRGDPLLNRQFPELTRIAKRYFPESVTMVTTHGSYPFRAELLACGLDELRLSIDGGTAAAYERYRRGGDFAKVVAWLAGVRNHRRQRQSHLQVIWKYILFEWNDSEEEIATAARLAEEYEAQLLFVFSQSAGRSLRLTEPADLAPILDRVAPRARISGRRYPWDPTHPIDEEQSQDHACADALTAAIAALRGGQRAEAFAHVQRALELDPGLPPATPALRVEEDLPPARLLDWIVERARSPNTLSALAYLAELDGAWQAAFRLQRRYLQVGPETPQREIFELSLLHYLLRARLGSADPRDFLRRSPEELLETEREVLAIDPGHRDDGPLEPGLPPETWLAEILLPATLKILGYLRWARGDDHAAQTLFAAYFATRDEGQETPLRALATRLAAGRTRARLRRLWPFTGRTASVSLFDAG